MGLWSTKSMASLQNEATAEGENTLKRALGVSELVAVRDGAPDLAEVEARARAFA